MANQDKKNLRFNILTIIIYIIGIILLLQLFNLQIVHGEEYYIRSSTRLTRETTIEAARGNILDCNGNIIAGTVTRYSVLIYKSKVDSATLNNTILNVINILEENQDEYKDSFPISINPIAFTIQDEEKLKEWKISNKLDENITAEEALDKYKDKYNITNGNIEDIRKIIAVRYGIEKEGYSSMSPYIISENINSKSVAKLEEQNSNFSGISINTKALRNYPMGNLASHVLGYIGPIDSEELKKNPDYLMNDYIGKNGIEYVFEKYLKGRDGIKQTDMAIDGTLTGEYVTEEAVGGNDVVLTIDANLQYSAEMALKNNIEKINNGGFGTRYNATGGTVVVLNVKTGEVLTMCSYPDFEPELFIDGISTAKWNEYNDKEKSSLINRCIQSAYAPGSIFKMVPAIAGLETDAITTTEKILDTGIFSKGHHPRCWIYPISGGGHGWLNVSGAIKHSCNCFFYEVGSRIGIETLEKYSSYFGLGQKTNIELPGEVSGTLAGKTLYDELNQSRGTDEKLTWYYGNTLSAVIGQAENNFTPMQMAKYIAMLVSGGKDLDITLIKEIIVENGEKLDKTDIQQYVNERLGINKVTKEDLGIKQENINAVLEGMRSVTTETGGTAYSVFKNFDIEVGGKTGSAEAGGKVNAWFAGFAPYNDPEIAIIVNVENGGHGYYTAEVAKEILGVYFGLNEYVNENRTALPFTQSQN